MIFLVFLSDILILQIKYEYRDKRSIKPVDYSYAINLLEERLEKVINNRAKELIWFLEHNKIYTAGTSFNKSDVLDKSIKVIKTSRGGKITCHVQVN